MINLDLLHGPVSPEEIEEARVALQAWLPGKDESLINTSGVALLQSAVMTMLEEGKGAKAPSALFVMGMVAGLLRAQRVTDPSLS